jgi:hypothetical protein
MAESGWLIEIKISDGPQWIYSISEKGALLFTRDSNRAIRFSRKCDAEIMASNIGVFCTVIFSSRPELLATEHQWD